LYSKNKRKIKKNINKRVNYIKERKNDGWKKSRVGRLIFSKENFVSIVKTNVLDSPASLQS